MTDGDDQRIFRDEKMENNELEAKPFLVEPCKMPIKNG